MRPFRPRELPDIPEEHLLTPFARYMAHTINELHWMVSIRLVADMILLCVMLFFIWRVWQLTRAVDRRSAAAADDRLHAAEDRVTIAGMLKTIKGWSVINVAVEDRKVETVKEAAADLKHDLDLLPEKTAAATVTKLEEKAASESTIMKTPPAILRGDK